NRQMCIRDRIHPVLPSFTHHLLSHVIQVFPSRQAYIGKVNIVQCKRKRVCYTNDQFSERGLSLIHISGPRDPL
ncbi:hypothetical protein ACQ4LK_23150, partial [Bacillus pumilus]